MDSNFSSSRATDAWRTTPASTSHSVSVPHGHADAVGIASKLFLLVSALLLPGCAAFTLPNPEPEAAYDIDVPPQWHSELTGGDGPISTNWLTTFADPDMERLVAEALQYNRDIRAAAARLKTARESTIISRAARLPSAGASSSGSLSTTKAQDDGNWGGWESSDNYRISLNLSWEVDLWGRLRDLHLAAIDDYLAATADFQGARLSLAGTTAKAWFNLIAAEQQVELARQTRDSFERNYRITERNYRAGDATALDVQFGRNNVASAERALINRRLGRDEAARTLEILIGRYPSGEVKARRNLPALEHAVPVGLPSGLLMRRPDLEASAADVRATARRADAARKNLLPSISLSADGGTSSDDLLDLLDDPRSIAMNVAASIAQPIYRAGALSAQARQALARNEAAIETFASTALQAFREVETALSVEQSLALQEEFLNTELKQANLAEAQASRDYSEGLVGILEVLEAQRRAFNARNSMIGLRNERLQNRVDLHLALGGDFEALPDRPVEDQLNARR